MADEHAIEEAEWKYAYKIQEYLKEAQEFFNKAAENTIEATKPRKGRMVLRSDVIVNLTETIDRLKLALSLDKALFGLAKKTDFILKRREMDIYKRGFGGLKIAKGALEEIKKAIKLCELGISEVGKGKYGQWIIDFRIHLHNAYNDIESLIHLDQTLMKFNL